jgi:dTDP-4-dehydrorhamnose reductase/dTDP-4-dehydrorhamnose 3,5-epimerase
MPELAPVPDSIEYKKPLEVHKTNIAGLEWYDLTVNPDDRGWFKENWNREKMMVLGLPDFEPIQNNVSYNNRAATRGLHAEPWDKFVAIGNGRVFGAWTDLREGSETYGKAFTLEMDPSIAIFVPRGVANGFQALEDDVVYSYLVNEHWSLEAKSEYTFVNLADPTLNIQWPIPLDEVNQINPKLISDDDRTHAMFADVIPMKPKKTLVTGANGQVGKALRDVLPNAEFVTHDELDITSDDLETARSWRQYDTIIDASAFTKVDLAETPDGRVEAWGVNGFAAAALGRLATKYRMTFVNFSTDYVFDGSISPHSEDEPLSPLSVYGQSKAAGDIATAIVPKHYDIRTSWVVGDGNNTVNTFKSLAERGVKPSVVNDQIGRLSFASDIAKAVKHLLDTAAPYGTYNVSNDGDSVSWADIAKRVYELSGKSADDVTPVSTAEYYAGKDGIAPRPLQSTLSLDKIKATGFVPRNMDEALIEYLAK